MKGEKSRSISIRVCAAYRNLQSLRSVASLHKDPFDRMLIAQALAENIPIVSNDRALED
ncbi:MAG: PIN domain-containing protein [Candidatus Sulfotelmatobacter sp.]